MQTKYFPDDMCYGVVTEKDDKSIEIHRFGFQDESSAKDAIEAYAKKGSWPNQVKEDTEEK